MSQTGAPSETCTLTALQQSLMAVSILFISLGSGLAGIVGKYLGRRGTIQVGSVLVLAGAGGMVGTSGSFTAYIACKCLQGLGLGHYVGSAPTYRVECMVPRKRGMLTALFNCGLGMGNVVAAADARQSFARIYAKDPNSAEVTTEVQDVLHAIEFERTTESVMKWTKIFEGVDLRRTLTSTLILVGLAITGFRFVAMYSTIFLAGIGISNPYAINCIVAACVFIGSVPPHGSWNTVVGASDSL
ncbi:hypothetical protein BJX66DRAFT_341933 [Aspergillus keveii]|uniref:Major facilitator superfamily (MFS) profile domain-containing protein n=1 Tax=Aspergillus keveii TaxID=714993 RepID=A0ABR4FUQ6_9EURO